MTVVAINSVKELDDLADQCRCLVVHFAADFVDQCAQVDQVMNQLAADYHQQQQLQQLQEEQQQQQLVRFCRVLAEQVPDLSTAHAITAAPTVVLLLANSGATPDSGRFSQFGRVEGVNSRQLTDKVCQLTAAAAANAPSSFATASPPPAAAAAAASTATTTAAGGGDSEKELLRQRLRQLITRSKCMVFMKGTPDQPRCGFSRQLVALLRATSCQFDSFDILTDEPVRQELKVYSNWPTYPQLYVDGELVGGLDIVRDLSESGELTATLGL